MPRFMAHDVKGLPPEWEDALRDAGYRGEEVRESIDEKKNLVTCLMLSKGFR